MAIRFLITPEDSINAARQLNGSPPPTGSVSLSPNSEGAEADSPRHQTDPVYTPETRSWSAGALGLAPLYTAIRANGTERVAGSEAREVAVAMGHPSLDPVAMFEDLVLGFRVARRSLFQGVERLSPDEHLELSDRGPAVVQELPALPCEEDSGPALDAAVARTASLAAQDTILELTGGVDSRVVLALCLKGGQKPAGAFTLGHQDSPDVLAARSIAERFGIEHVVIEPHAVTESILTDAHDYARASGYACSTASYAWLPEVFRRLAQRRTTQLSGVGGERAGGFYYTPLDRFSGIPGFTRAWMKYRLRIPGVVPAQLFLPKAASGLNATMIEELAALFKRNKTAWRTRTDSFYECQRLRLWAGASLRAASHWYEPQAPLLWPEFTPWIQMVAQRAQNPRQALVELIGQLYPDLAELPYASDFATAHQSARRSSKPAKLAGKVLRRLRQSPKAAELGATRVAASLTVLPEVRESIERLIDAQSDVLSPDAIQLALAEPEQCAHALGFLFTWAFAQSDLDKPELALHLAPTL